MILGLSLRHFQSLGGNAHKIILSQKQKSYTSFCNKLAALLRINCLKGLFKVQWLLHCVLFYSLCTLRSIIPLFSVASVAYPPHACPYFPKSYLLFPSIMVSCNLCLLSHNLMMKHTYTFPLRQLPRDNMKTRVSEMGLRRPCYISI